MNIFISLVTGVSVNLNKVQIIYFLMSSSKCKPSIKFIFLSSFYFYFKKQKLTQIIVYDLFMVEGHPSCSQILFGLRKFS